jgi:hypothetical protein
MESFGLPAKGRNLALFGFVFSPSQSMKFFIITFHIRLCANFALPQIGFVFSNSPSGETPPGGSLIP